MLLLTGLVAHEVWRAYAHVRVHLGPDTGRPHIWASGVLAKGERHQVPRHAGLANRGSRALPRDSQVVGLAEARKTEARRHVASLAEGEYDVTAAGEYRCFESELARAKGGGGGATGGYRAI